MRTTEAVCVGLGITQKYFEALRGGKLMENVSVVNTHKVSSASVSSRSKKP